MSTSFDGDGADTADTADTSKTYANNGAFGSSDDETMLSADLTGTHQRLVTDGASWRRRLPSSERLIQRAHAELAGRTPVLSAEQQAPSPLQTVYLPDHTPTPKGYTQMSEAPRTPMTIPRQATKSARLRAWLGAAVAIVVVGLLVGLLYQNGVARRTGPGATSHATPTIPPTPSSPPAVATNTDGSPAFTPILAPSDPQNVYAVSNNKLKHSTDGGKTYQQVKLPSIDLTQVSISVAVSPLDAQRIYVTFAGLRNNQGCLPSSSGAPAISIQQHTGKSAQQSAYTQLSGYGPCVEQYTSANAGSSWNRVHLPIQGVLGATTFFRTFNNFETGAPYTFSVQGTRLYAAAAFGSQDGSLLDAPGIRIVRSDDNGATWSLVDSGLPTKGSGQQVCDFAPAPTSQTVYAITSPGCNGEGTSTVSLWRSDNGGSSWAQIHTFNNVGEAGMVVTANGTLYLDLPKVQWFTSGAPAPNTNHNAGSGLYSALSGGGSITATADRMLVSVNEGASFTAAPSKGVPAGASFWGPYALLADGSVVGLEVSSSGATVSNAFYFWQAGQTSWQMVSGSLTSDSYVYAQATGVGGQEMLYAVTYSGKIVSFTFPMAS